MKKTSLFFFLLLTIACQKEQHSVENLKQSVQSSEINSASTSTSMYDDPDYIALNNLSYQLVSQLLPNADLQYLLNASGTISQSQFIYTVKQMGFKDTTAYRAFQNKQIPLQQRLHAKYFSGNGSISPYVQPPQGNFANQCQAAYSSCTHAAAADYTFHIIDCTGLAFGIGAVGFGIGGLLFQLACGAYSINVLNEARADCNANYQACINP